MNYFADSPPVSEGMMIISALRSRLRPLKDRYRKPVLERKGFCNVCEAQATFVSYNAWLRENYFCTKCHSRPRNRAVINALNVFVPGWREQTIHESSPSDASLQRLAWNYSSSHFIEGLASGAYSEQFKTFCQDLRHTSFKNDALDVLVTQDVMEHVFEPEKAFSEIARILKPGGSHVFTIPLHDAPTRARATLDDTGTIRHLMEPEYHGAPFEGQRALVATDWGYDLAEIIKKHSGMETTVYHHEDPELGMEGEGLYVLISKKMAS
jgi:hypothetical protein